MPINLASLRTGKTIYDLFDSEKIAKTYIDSLSYPDLRHKIGIELEFLSPLSRGELVIQLMEQGINIRSGSRGDSDYSTWLIKSDGSVNMLQEDHIEISKQFNKIRKSLPRFYPHEISSPIIHNTSELKEIAKICKLLSKPYSDNSNFPIAFVNSTCGLHIHVDIMGDSLATKESIYNLFKTCEPELNCLIPPSRIINRYCKPVKGLALKTRNDLDKHFSVYQHPGTGTFEYRKFYATKSWWIIKCLILILDSIHNYAKRRIIPYNYQCSLYDIVDSTILQHFISSQKKVINTYKDSILSDIPKNIVSFATLEPQVWSSRIPLLAYT